MSTSITLGKKYKDYITGFEGIAVARIEYITGCIQYELLPQGLQKDGKPKESKWYDQVRISKDGKGPNHGPNGGPPPSSTPDFNHP